MRKIILILLLGSSFLLYGYDLRREISDDIHGISPIEVEYRNWAGMILRPEALWSNLEKDGIKKEYEFGFATIEDKREKNGPLFTYEDGYSVLFKAEYPDGQEEGEEKYISITSYKDGYNHGKYYYFYKGFKGDYKILKAYVRVEKLFEGEYFYGDKTGEWKESDITCEYLNGRLHGKWRDNKTGKTFQYVNGFKHGIWEETGEDNSVVTVEYIYGKRVGDDAENE